MKRGLFRKIIYGTTLFALSTSITFTSLSALTYQRFDEDLLDNKKYMDKVEEKLDANMKIMELYDIENFNSIKT